jgi:transposase
MARKKGSSTRHDKKKAAARNKAQTKEKEQFLRLLDQLCQSITEPQPIDKKDRLSLSDMLYCLILKVYLQLSSRTHVSFLDEIYTLKYITRIPGFNSIINYMNSADVTLLLERLHEKTGHPLRGEAIHAAIDSTKLLTQGYSKKKNKKDRMVRQRNFVRLHVTVDIKSHLILTAKVSKHFEDEKPFFEPLLRLAVRRFHILSIAGDKNYASEANMKIAEELGCTPYLTPKKNYKSDAKKRSASWNNDLERYRERTAEDSERFDQRKQIETAFSMIKRRFRSELRSENYQAQINEALCLAICHNLRVLIFNREMHGLEITFPADEGWAVQSRKLSPTTADELPRGKRPEM